MATFCALLEADPDIIKAYIDGLAGTTLNEIEIASHGQKIFVFADKT